MVEGYYECSGQAQSVAGKGCSQAIGSHKLVGGIERRPAVLLSAHIQLAVMHEL